MLSDLPVNISTFGGDIDSVITFIWWTVAVWFIATEALLIYFVVRYRHRDGVRAAWMPADTLKTSMWVLAPVFVVLVFDLAIEAYSAGVWDEVKTEIPAHDVHVKVTARQFAWTFTYAGADGKLDTADDFESMTEMHVPRDKVVRLELESVDVLHSFWVPVLRLKQDVVPGRRIPAWFSATQDGVYEIPCAELCGPAHTSMRGLLTVESPELFQQWSDALSAQQAEQREVAAK